MQKRLLAWVLCFALLLTPVAALRAQASNAYYINGVYVHYDDFSSSRNECWVYANQLYNKIWGKKFTSDFQDGDNFLRNLRDEELTLTREHLIEYVSHAELGSVLRICNSNYLHSNDGWGHSQIIVQKDANGFTVLEGGLSTYPYCREKYYTWQEYCSTSWLGGKYAYVKYIKWPGARAYAPGSDGSFSDVAEGTWYYDAVSFVLDKGLFSGATDREFRPNDLMTRGMLVTVLWRLAGKPDAADAVAFKDVKTGKYYAKAVRWASANGIVAGVDPTHFVPDGNVTREQLATVLYRYAGQAGYACSARADLSGFPDVGGCSAYARNALSWANAAGLLAGEKNSGTVRLNPKGYATRAQVAAVLMRFLELEPLDC